MDLKATNVFTGSLAARGGNVISHLKRLSNGSLPCALAWALAFLEDVTTTPPSPVYVPVVLILLELQSPPVSPPRALEFEATSRHPQVPNINPHNITLVTLINLPVATGD